ncbi:pyridoxamine 5'-phosphate oxidase family protein [Candidatus Microgenomates bacterium]|nr:pyridoxamine 5'-phosphate oxidase family protein [Candidatus Microgenomates bacterium]
MSIDLVKLAREIIEKNQYLVMASPWISILCYAYDKDWNFYVASMDNSRHVQEISKNNTISFAIFDSHQDWGLGVGLQIEGKIEKTGTLLASKIYFSRKFPYGNISGAFALGFKKLLANKTYSFYKIAPTKIWMNDPEEEFDTRIEIKL